MFANTHPKKLHSLQRRRRLCSHLPCTSLPRFFRYGSGCFHEPRRPVDVAKVPKVKVGSLELSQSIQGHWQLAPGSAVPRGTTPAGVFPV